MEPTTAERLVRLRSLLIAAQASASDETAVGRHSAVIALDGVCELALGLAAHHLGVPVASKGGLPALLERVRSHLGKRWVQDGVQGFVELHRARNDAQHYGLLPDAAHVPLWTAEVERFVRSLVAASFAQDLAAVSAASAVEAEDLRTLLIRAEEELGANEDAESLKSSYEAFERALRAFRARRGSNPFRFRSDAFRKFGEFQDIKSTIEELEQFVDVATLAADPGEWIWLRSVIGRLGSSAAAPTHADAQRGLAFTLSWVLRYEAFVHRYPTAESDELGHVRPSLDERYEKPRVTAIAHSERHAVRGQEFVVFDVTLSHLPPEWDYEVSAATKRFSEAAEHPAKFSALLVGDTLVIEVSDAMAPADVLGLIDAILDETHHDFEARLQRWREARDEAIAVANRYRADLAEHDAAG